MNIYMGSSTIDKLYIGNQQVDGMYFGEELIYDNFPKPPIENGLVLWLKGSDIVTDKWYDRSESGYHFDINGTGATSMGNYISFDGNTYCTLNQSMTNVQTLIVMFKHYSSSQSAAWKYLLDSRNNSLSTGQVYIATSDYSTINNFSGFSSYVKTGTDGATMGNIPSNTLTHFCATFDTAPETLNFVLCSNNAKRETLMCDIYGVFAYNRILTQEELTASIDYMKSLV